MPSLPRLAPAGARVVCETCERPSSRGPRSGDRRRCPLQLERPGSRPIPRTGGRTGSAAASSSWFPAGVPSPGPVRPRKVGTVRGPAPDGGRGSRAAGVAQQARPAGLAGPADAGPPAEPVGVGEQLGVGPPLDDQPAVHDDDQVGVDDRVQPALQRVGVSSTRRAKLGQPAAFGWRECPDEHCLPFDTEGSAGC